MILARYKFLAQAKRLPYKYLASLNKSFHLALRSYRPSFTPYVKNELAFWLPRETKVGNGSSGLSA
jgi:hypothetical protein